MILKTLGGLLTSISLEEWYESLMLNIYLLVDLVADLFVSDLIVVTSFGLIPMSVVFLLNGYIASFLSVVGNPGDHSYYDSVVRTPGTSDCTLFDRLVI